MSAYIVEDKTINRIVAWLEFDEAGSQRIAKHTLQQHGYDLSRTEEAERLANEMFQLNINAVEQRYGVGEAAEFRPLDFKYRSSLPQPIMHTLKALHCWSYQCSEGDVPDTPLYQMFDEIEANMCRHIIGSLPEYNEAPWA